MSRLCPGCGLEVVLMDVTIALPPGVDAPTLIAQLMSYGAIIVPIVASVGAFWLICRVLKYL